MSIRIGLYGGTFDPPHRAHLELADWVVDYLDLAALYFIPTAVHPLKDNRHLTPADLRFKMLQAALWGHDRLRISRIEMNQHRPSYTVDTLRQFTGFENLTDVNLIYLMGVDNVHEIHLWKEPEKILQLADIYVLQRPGYNSQQIPTDLQNRLKFLPAPSMDISASEIREMINRGEDVAHLLPENVYSIIRKHHLYGYNPAE
jgi:nicotinate-nucleotide adenylyltransferase